MLWDRSNRAYPGRNDELGLSAIRQPAQRGQIQMIVVIVAEEHGIDAGKILPPHSRLPAAARTDRGERTGPLRPDRIGQNVDAALLEQQRGMVDQRNPQLIAFHARTAVSIALRPKRNGRMAPAGW